MEHPEDIKLPFFAYGHFRPGQLAFFQVRDLVSTLVDPIQIKGRLRLRDGLPILDVASSGRIPGALITFRPDQAAEAYSRIAAMEPDKQYRWHVTAIDGMAANVLAGRKPGKGSVDCEEEAWDGWNDPLFTSAIDVVEETVNSQEFKWDLKPLFRLQMAYLLLWSSIERYVALRYHLGGNVLAKVYRLAQEPAFMQSLRDQVSRTDEVYRADGPDDKATLNSEDAKKSLAYYYQVRCNITHRGKGVVRDFDRVQMALKELLSIFREVLAAAQRDAVYPT